MQGASDAALGEDIIAIWSNAAGPATVTFTLSANGDGAPPPSEGGGKGVGQRSSVHFQEVTLTTLVAGLPRADLPEQLFPASERLDRPPAQITVRPLREFIFLSVISDGPASAGWPASPRRISSGCTCRWSAGVSSDGNSKCEASCRIVCPSSPRGL
ncbi:MAG: hypothetical protein FJ011_26995 [Chloroflexi bacterium]|nr:hypothetical protein [Chloroflexota bacterium]